VYSVEGVTTVSATYTVAANVTSFEIPATAPAFSCGHTLKVLLTAVRGTIMSAPAQNGLSSICPPPSSGANSPVSNLPRTGALADRGDRRATVELIAILLLMSGASLVWFGRSRPRL
jgi:hypothetical protein